MRKASKPRKKEVKYLSTDQIQDLFRVIDNVRDRAIFRLVYHRGLRVSEVGLLKMSDFRAREGRLYVTRLKGSNSGEFRLLDEELRCLKAWIKERGTHPGPIFLSRNHSPIGRGRLDQMMRSYSKLAGIPADKGHMHALKHSCGTHLMERVSDITLVQDWLGHRNIQNTMIYVAITNKRRDEVAEKNRDWR